jgi:hypothetical protein
MSAHTDEACDFCVAGRRGGLRSRRKTDPDQGDANQNGFVVNIGELLGLPQMAICGHGSSRCRAATGAARLAVAFFLGAQHDATVPCSRFPALAAGARGATSDPDNPLFQHVGLSRADCVRIQTSQNAIIQINRGASDFRWGFDCAVGSQRGTGRRWRADTQRFELQNDQRPQSQSTASSRYEEPTLFE